MTTAPPHGGAWSPGPEAPVFDARGLIGACARVREAAAVIVDPETGRIGVGFGGDGRALVGVPLLASLPPIYPEWLGDRSFAEVHGVRFPYVAGAMANGIATARLVVTMARAGCLGFFGAAGLDPQRVEQGIDEIEAALGTSGAAWGSNLIHSPQEPDLEMAVAALYIRRGVRLIEASAYMALTPAVVRVSASGLRQHPDGRIERRHQVFAKISRPEVARRFLEPPPKDMLDGLVRAGHITAEEARIALLLPVAEDITVEADSGGHTDNQPLPALFPTISLLRDRIAAERGYSRPIRVGAAGGLGTPQAVAGAFALGAAYVLTGSVNQACVESGLSEAGRKMLADASLADVVMAPAADMFEMGVEVQVLQRGTMFATRGKRLFHLYRGYPSMAAIPADDRARLEREVFRCTLDQAWAETAAFWRARDPRELARAEADPKHQMALVFRSYLGRASRWAIAGESDRRIDYQIWCGPAMGAFNSWVEGSFLAEPAARTVDQVARNLMEGAAVVTRAQQLRTFGVPVPPSAFDFRPRPLA